MEKEDVFFLFSLVYLFIKWKARRHEGSWRRCRPSDVIIRRRETIREHEIREENNAARDLGWCWSLEDAAPLWVHCWAHRKSREFNLASTVGRRTKRFHTNCPPHFFFRQNKWVSTTCPLYEFGLAYNLLDIYFYSLRLPLDDSSWDNPLFPPRLTDDGTLLRSRERKKKRMSHYRCNYKSKTP